MRVGIGPALRWCELEDDSPVVGVWLIDPGANESYARKFDENGKGIRMKIRGLLAQNPKVRVEEMAQIIGLTVNGIE
jgi:hypothetical protein